ncbi:hypothetical protein KKC22_11690 [Myxococcota bacterium]|nr:hypothetical protein [Myxococcota bacterium]
MTEVSNRPMTDVLHAIELVHLERKGLSASERFLAASLHHHLMGDGRAVRAWLSDITTPEAGELLLRASLFTDNPQELEDLFARQLPHAAKWTVGETQLWCQVWLFLFPNPGLARKALSASTSKDLLEERVTTLQQLQEYGELETLLSDGGMNENRTRLALTLGDLQGKWHEAIRHLPRQNALDTLMKIEFVCRAEQDEDMFWATEMNLFAALGETDFRDAVQFLHASRDREEIAIEQLMTLAEHPSWGKALAIRVAFSIAARHNEDATLLRLYYKLYQTAKKPDLKIAACMRAGLIAENRLKRYREAEEFYRVALELDPENFFALRGLFRMLLVRRAYGEIVELAGNCKDPYLHKAAAFLAEVRLYNFSLALSLAPEEDRATRSRLTAGLGRWDELEKLYGKSDAPVPAMVAELVCATIDARRSDFGKAVSRLTTLRKSAPFLTALLCSQWQQIDGKLTHALEWLEEAAQISGDRTSRQSICLQGANWCMTEAPATAAKWLGRYMDDGGTIPETAETGRQWFELLMGHPSPKPEWFVSLAPTLDSLIQESDTSRNWTHLARLLNIKLLMSRAGPEKIEPLLQLAKICEEQLQDIPRSISCYTEVLGIDSHQKIALEALSRIYETTESWDEYLRVIRLSMEANEDPTVKSSLYFKYGSILETQFNKVDEALKYYKLSCETASASLPALHGIRDIYVRKENWNGVLNTLKMEASIWDDNKEKAGIYTQMGDILMEKLSKEEQAMRYFEAALSLRPDSPGALRSLFQLYFRQSAWDKASELAVSLGPKALTEGSAAERAELNYHRGIVFKHSGDKMEAARCFVTALDLNPKAIEPLYAFLEISTLFEEVNAVEEFLDELTGIYEQVKDVPEAPALISIAKARLHVLNHLHEEALQLFRDARKQSPTLLEAVVGECQILLAMQEEDNAFNIWNEYAAVLAKADAATVTQEQLVKAYLAMARFFSENLGKNREAMNLLRKVLEKAQNDTAALLELASELFGNNQIRESQVTLERLLTLSRKETSNSGRIHAFAAMLYAEVGEDKKAQDLLTGLDPSQVSPQDAILYAYVFAKRNETAKALDLLRKVPCPKSEDKQEISLHLAVLQSIAGNTNAAIDELEVLAGNSIEAAELLVDVLVRQDEKRNIARHMDFLLPTHFDDINYLQILEDYLPPNSPRRRRIQIVRELFDAEFRTESPAQPLLKNNAMAGDEFRNIVGIKDTTGPSAQLWNAIRGNLEVLFKPIDPSLAEARRARGPELLAWEEIEATLGQSAELWVGDITSRPILVFSRDDVFQIVVEPRVFDFPISTIRFLLGRALESARSGFSLLFLLTEAQRHNICKLMYSVALPPNERDETARKFVASLERPAQKALERVSLASWDIFPQINLVEWMDSVDLALDKVGLLLSGDPSGAFQGATYLVNKHVQMTDKNLANFVLAPRAESLLKCYLSTTWDKYVDAMQ